MKNNYGDCMYCGGHILEKHDRVDYRYHGQLFIMENVPTGICTQCGEKFLTAKISKKLEKEASKCHKPSKMVAIPVISIAA
ncbi:MAG TPA: hypothetical protein DDW49_10780 [Deltaproteobacteria bacterium]|nr:MAG: hypothetical protein A2048_07095 [Deltaproteobacteria bacterium GWA2_45_12]HBF13848.1 hypothetical protein [Deltaproteobacteria bacterium]